MRLKFLVALVILLCATDAPAENLLKKSWQRLGRFTGYGWGDGYHAPRCCTNGCDQCSGGSFTLPPGIGKGGHDDDPSTSYMPPVQMQPVVPARPQPTYVPPVAPAPKPMPVTPPPPIAPQAIAPLPIAPTPAIAPQPALTPPVAPVQPIVPQPLVPEPDPNTSTSHVRPWGTLRGLAPPLAPRYMPAYTAVQPVYVPTHVPQYAQPTYAPQAYAPQPMYLPQPQYAQPMHVPQPLPNSAAVPVRVWQTQAVMPAAQLP